MIRKIIALLALVVLFGCGPGDFVTLDARWAPLRRVEQAPWVEPGVMQTRINIVYVHDITDFTDLDEIDQNAILIHEQTHAIHEQEVGVVDFDRQYAYDLAFRAQEEKAGWALQIRYEIWHHRMVNPYFVAQFMSTHYGGVFEYNSILAWIAEVISEAYNGQ